MIGRAISHFEIIEKLGEGGMGVVYKARDTHLDRFVAIKVLPAEKVADPDRKRRFVQEAKAASALNHPNIITIYDIAGENGMDFIVMEYVPGKTLAEVIPRRGLRLNEALKYAVQVADALAAAHAAGIVHRDLKPGNVMATAEGRVKVLDFGLAKLTETSDSVEEEATRTLRPQTEEGTILGTVAYMSPEQAEGKQVDARSDIFSFGALLYEMVTGHRAFHGDSRMSTLAAILDKDPRPASEITPAVPRDLEKLINRCLRKDLERRTQHMGDVKLTLLELKEESESGALGPAPGSAREGRKRIWWAGAALVAVVIVSAAALFFSGRREAPEPILTTVPLTTDAGSEAMPSFSPDGNQVAFAWNGEKQDNWDIYVKLIGGGPPLRLTTDSAPDGAPAWSPEGRWIAFLRRKELRRTELLLIPALGGQERRLAEVVTESGYGWLGPRLAWSQDGKHLVFPDTPASEPPGLFLLSLGTGEERRLTSAPANLNGDFAPAFSPDGRTLAFVRAGSVDVRHLYLLSLSEDLRPSGEPRRFVPQHESVWGLAWTSDGREIVFSAGPEANLRLWRAPVFGTAGAGSPLFAGENGLEVAISPQGHRLVYTVGIEDSNIWRGETSAGGAAPVRLIASTRFDGNAQYSADGKRIVFGSARSGHFEIWVCDADGAHAVQQTSLQAHSGTPRWFPDGRRIVFDSNKEGRFQIYDIDAGGGMPRRVTDSPADDAAPSASRDGKWIYFSSKRTGRWEVWRMPAEGGEAGQVTKHGGFSPFESFDAKVLYYQKAVGVSDVWKVAVEGGEETGVLGPAGYRMFSVVREGIYFIQPPVEGAKGSLRFFDIATGTAREVARIQKAPNLGLSVSSDGRFALYSQTDQEGSDLILVENFR